MTHIQKQSRNKPPLVIKKISHIIIGYDFHYYSNYSHMFIIRFGLNLTTTFIITITNIYYIDC